MDSEYSRDVGVDRASAARPLPDGPSPAASATVWLVAAVHRGNTYSTTRLLAVLSDALGRYVRVRTLSSQRTLETGYAARSRARLLGWFASRAVQGVGDSLRVALVAFRDVGRDDIVFVVTNPPALPFLVQLVAAIRRAHVVVIVHDVYPEVLESLGLLSAGSLLSRSLDRVLNAPLRRAQRIVVIGRDMRDAVRRKLGTAADRIVCIPNWADPEVISRTGDAPAVRPGDSLVVQYSGNMGATHAIDTALDTAALAADAGLPVQFQLYGWGMRRDFIDDRITAYGLRNVVTGGPCPTDELAARLRACDVGLILMRRNMTGLSVPSRLYNLMAAGKPVILAADEASEAALVVRELGIGWVVEPEDPQALFSALKQAWQQRDELPAMGRRAASAARREYTLERAVARYRALIDDIWRTSACS